VKIAGQFEVKLHAQQATFEGVDGVNVGRMSLSKVFSGDLAAESHGEMLSAVHSNGSAGYVALEQVVGTLAGRTGSFVMQHLGTHFADQSKLTLQVLPGSGAGELATLSGQMAIRIENGQHFYDFEFEF
jgi:hypothetical protein